VENSLITPSKDVKPRKKNEKMGYNYDLNLKFVKRNSFVSLQQLILIQRDIFS
jgi:hypothetical protein